MSALPGEATSTAFPRTGIWSSTLVFSPIWKGSLGRNKSSRNKEIFWLYNTQFFFKYLKTSSWGDGKIRIIHLHMFFLNFYCIQSATNRVEPHKLSGSIL